MDREDVAHIYNGILLSHYKEWNNAICSNMDGPKQSQRKINIRHCLYAESKKIDTNELTYKTETDLENKHIWLPKGKHSGEGCIRSLGLTYRHYYI